MKSEKMINYKVNMKSQKTCNFGEHLMIDGYGGDPKRLNDKDLVMLSLVELPHQLGMTRLSDPMVMEAPDNNIKDPGGWSGFVIIAESHISVHTFPKRKFVSIDVYTCRNGLNSEFVKKYFKDTFKLKDIEENFVKRGTRYPAHNIK
jgi:S-adenosylmethionine decarboxylase